MDFVNIAYLIVHPKGTVMFDAGAIPDSHFKKEGEVVTEGIMTANKPLKPQLAMAGYTPAAINYLVLSHYHSDHTANANDFSSATWIVQKAERDYMFGADPQGIIQPSTYSALRNAKTKVLAKQGKEFTGHSTTGALEADVTLDKSGSIMIVDMQVGPQKVKIERVYVNGSF